ncbi:unnamed protein product [Diamesa serratosioi]
MSETITKSAKKKNGRPNHQGWEIYKFKMVKNESTNKASAICMVCNKPQRNTSITRLASHRKVCGTSVVHKLNVPKVVETEDYVDEKTKLEEFEECEDIEYEFAEDASQPETVVLPSVFEIVNEDIKVHLPISPPASKVSVNSQRNLDTALSSFLISCNQSFSMVDNKHFRNFVRTLNSGYRIPTSMELKSDTIAKIQKSTENNERRRLKYSEED